MATKKPTKRFLITFTDEMYNDLETVKDTKMLLSLPETVRYILAGYLLPKISPEKDPKKPDEEEEDNSSVEIKMDEEEKICWICLKEPVGPYIRRKAIGFSGKELTIIECEGHFSGTQIPQGHPHR